MHLVPYTSAVRAQLAAAGSLGDATTQAVADALATAAEPAVRLAILEAVSAVADEITAALLDAPGSPAVAVRLDADDVRVEVRVAQPAAPPAAVVDEAENDARISLRLPESLKSSIEGAARSEGLSVNTWLLRAASFALTPRTGPSGHSSIGGRITGWING